MRAATRFEGWQALSIHRRADIIRVCAGIIATSASWQANATEHSSVPQAHPLSANLLSIAPVSLGAHREVLATKPLLGGANAANEPAEGVRDNRFLLETALAQVADDNVYANNPPAPKAAPKEQEIVVSVDRPRGSVIGDIPPERTFKTLDVRAVGATDVQDLLQSLGARTGLSSNDGDPIVLLNGRRVSSFAEIARIPTEAIERMEVFPPELAIRYGYAANRKVVNIVVFERFSSRLGQLSIAAPSEGGRSTPGAALNYLRIRGSSRFNLDADYSRSDSLLESDRGVVQPAGRAGQSEFRTLLPSNERLSLNATLSRELIKDVATTLNATFETSAIRSLFGLGPGGLIIGSALTQAGHIGTTWNGRIARWQWTITGNHDYTRTITKIDSTAGLAAANEARSINRVTNADLLLTGPLLDLPAGPLSLSATAEIEFLDFQAESVMSGALQAGHLSRDRTSLNASIDLPIANRQKHALAGLGDLSINVNARVQDLSDVGTLNGHGLGLTWSPVPALTLIGSTSYDESAPTVQQLGAPAIVTPNVRLFDFTRQETVDVTRLAGGNPNLRPERRHSYNLGLTAKPFAKADFVISLDYRSVRVTDPLAEFPIITPAVEQAFADRFTRNSDGQLLRLNATPVNFAQSHQEDVRVGLSFSRPLGSVPTALQAARVRVVQSEADIQRTLRPGNRVSRVEPGSAAARQVENLTSRLYLGFTYTLRLRDELSLSRGGPELNLLDGDAVDPRGGRPRHEVEFQAGVFKRGLGARVSVNWQAGTRIEGAGEQLFFSDLATVNLAAFANLSERFGGKTAPLWLKDLRLSFSVLNLMNERPRVTDQTSKTPSNYQGAYLNPLGRVVSLSLRKMF